VVPAAPRLGSRLRRQLLGRDRGRPADLDELLWNPSCVDLQGDPRDVREAQDVDDIVALMRILGSVTRTPVLLLPETSDYEATAPHLVVES
jgi:hypothetical protein